jgi:hypothetical protein
MVAMAFWEAYVEGRNEFDKKKLGWKIKFGKYTFITAYHFYVFVVMWPLLLSLPLIIYGWDFQLFGILISAYFSGQVIEDFMWYVVNPVVKFKERVTRFSDYYPWIKIGGIKIVPWCYIQNTVIALLSWYFIWR